MLDMNISSSIFKPCPCFAADRHGKYTVYAAISVEAVDHNLLPASRQRTAGTAEVDDAHSHANARV